MIKMPAPDSSQVTPSDRISESDPVAVSKVFVLDTNVILHDARCIWKFEDNDLAIPITVLEELDRFKKGNEDINFQARQFLLRHQGRY